MTNEEIMCCEDFERVFHVRLAEKCCANCEYGDCEYEGCVTCSHPKRNDCGYGREEEEDSSRYYSYNARQCDVCDLWKQKGENND